MTTPNHQISEKFPRNHWYQPAEWERHDACWLAWPSHEKEWLNDLEPAQQEFINLCCAIAGQPVEQKNLICYPATMQNNYQSERLEILVLDEAGKNTVQKALKGIPANFHLMPFGDIWLRDIGPIFVRTKSRKLAALRFNFNGWGGKYIMPGDDGVARNIIAELNFPEMYFPISLEGGAIEVDGQGTCLTTRQCLLNENRNPGVSQEEIEATLKYAFGVSKVLWLNQGLINDHTDGHIDTIARFVAPRVVVCMQAVDADDPNRDVLEEIAKDLASFTDARERSLVVHRIPSPGKILNRYGEIMPASYLNFYISNTTVIVPIYGSPQDRQAVQLIAEYFPTRHTIGLSAKAILTGGGAFHCITQQQPAVRN